MKRRGKGRKRESRGGGGEERRGEGTERGSEEEGEGKRRDKYEGQFPDFWLERLAERLLFPPVGEWWRSLWRGR